MESLVLASCSASPCLLLSAARRRLLPQEDKRNNAANLSRKREKRRERKNSFPSSSSSSPPMSPATSTSPMTSPTATTDPVPRQRSSAMAPDLPTGTFASGPPEPQALPFFLSPPSPTPPLPAGHPLLQPLPPPSGPIIFRLHPAFIAEMNYRRSQSLARFLKDEGAVPPPEEDKKREQVIRKLKKPGWKRCCLKQRVNGLKLKEHMRLSWKTIHLIRLSTREKLLLQRHEATCH